MAGELGLWVGFNLFVLALLALDLGVFHRKAHEVTVREGVLWSVVWISLSLAFNVGIYLWRGHEAGLEFLTGYLIEKSLSVDNIFVFMLVFTYFKVPVEYQHRVLFWGILGALVMRGAMIVAGAGLMRQFHWIIYLFGGFLVLTALRIATQKTHSVNPDRNPAVRLLRRLMPISTDYDGSRLFTRIDGRLAATPLFATLLVVEFTDVVFALDSIPAIFAITTDPFIIYTSNVFAILGLRALYFALAGFLEQFHYLKPGLAVVLGFVGAKMLLADLYKVPVVASLLIIVTILATSVVASILWPQVKRGARLVKVRARRRSRRTAG
jgi:tellurite resistance protein TerC